jgi:predicted RNase H-like HicB family nuclease
MKIKAIVHEEPTGGFWGEVPAIPGCASQGDTLEELIENLKEAIEGCLAIDMEQTPPRAGERILEIAV